MTAKLTLTAPRAKKNAVEKSEPLGFPQPLETKYCPSSIDGYAGLDRVREILQRFAANPYESAWFFLGPSGLGKTTIAKAFAAAVNGHVTEIASKSCDLETVQSIAHRCAYVPWMGYRYHFFIINEADKMTAAAQLAFLSLLDATARPPATIFVFTANSTEALEERFLSRTRILEFDSDGVLDPGAELLARIWKAESRGKPPLDFVELLKSAQCNIREALMILEVELLSPSGTYAPGAAQARREQALAQAAELARNAPSVEPSAPTPYRKPPTEPITDTELAAKRRAAALKAWETMRRNQAVQTTTQKGIA